MPCLMMILGYEKILSDSDLKTTAAIFKENDRMTANSSTPSVPLATLSSSEINAPATSQLLQYPRQNHRLWFEA